MLGKMIESEILFDSVCELILKGVAVSDVPTLPKFSQVFNADLLRPKPQSKPQNARIVFICFVDGLRSHPCSHVSLLYFQRL